MPYYRRNVGVVFQDFKLLPTRTVYDNVAYALQVTGASRKQIRSTLPDILRLTGLSTKLHNYPHQLSGGEQQRVAVARAFASHPPLLLADEPTGNLDPDTSIGIMQLLYRINRAGTTVLVASHDNAMKALESGSAVLVFPGGDWEVHRPSWQSGKIDFGGRRVGRHVDVHEHSPAHVVGRAVGRLDDWDEHAEHERRDEHRRERGKARNGVALHRAKRFFEEERRLHVTSCLRRSPSSSVFSSRAP